MPGMLLFTDQDESNNLGTSSTLTVQNEAEDEEQQQQHNYRSLIPSTEINVENFSE